MKIVLMGTGEFALPTFRHLILSKDHDVVGVFTQPERTGRGHHKHVNPVRVLGEENGVPVFQPDSVNRPEVLEQLRHLEADIFVVAAYGQILKQVLLDIPRLGAFNLHGSLLPRYRGAAPVQYTIWKGDSTGGVTMFQIEPALDCGPVVGKVETPIGGLDTSGSLMLRLAELSVELTVDVLGQLERDEAVFQPQDESLVSLAPKIKKQQGVIDWNQSAKSIDCHIRAMQPWPKAVTWLHLEGRKPVRCILQSAAPKPIQRQASPGTIVVDSSGRREPISLLVSTADGWLKVKSVQPDGKKAMDASGFANGYLSAADARFGDLLAEST